MDSKIKLVIWDWYKTLSGAHLYQDLKDSHPGAYELVQKFFQEGDERLVKWMRGELEYKEIHKYFSSITGIDSKVFDDSLKMVAGNFDVDERILPFVRMIKQKGIKQVIATDNFDIWDEFFLPQYSQYLDELFDGNYNSAKFRILKADQGGALMKAIIKDFKLVPSQVLLIDDSEEVISVFGDLGGNVLHHEGINDLKKKLAILL